MASLQEVAQEAGVSKSVASRVLTGDTRARVSEATRERVRRAAERLQYVPSHRARALRFARSGAVGLIVPDVNNAVFAEMLGGVQDRARDAGMSVLLSQIDPPPAGREQLRELVAAGRVDGVLLQRREDFDDPMLEAVLTKDIPAVLINSKLPGRTGSVVLDDVAGALTATRHLIDLGHERIGHLAGVATHDTAVRRHQGFRDAMDAAGLPVRRAWVQHCGWEAPGGAAAVRQLMTARTRPTGLVVSSVNAAIGALSALSRMGVRVPEDLSVITINDTWVAQSWTPALTTVRMPLRALGGQACSMLLDHLAGARLHDTVVTDLTPELVVRGSTRAVP
ncbi:LacI family DNA-binding transcriptional regulator [Streptomyces sp. NPDC088124]|uniref:LacI family DNA-binding transcriptional regulator n=1 Tax=Streptomyces sp. NPDC088124 TaxID=3154654 RepID=UPI00343B2278